MKLPNIDKGYCKIEKENENTRKLCKMDNGQIVSTDISSFSKVENEDGIKACSNFKIPSCKKNPNYYFWVPYVLVLQGLLFMVPHWIWKGLEEGKMQCILEGVRDGNDLSSGQITKKEERKALINNIAKFIRKQNNSRGHEKYAASFMLCQVLSLLNVVLNFAMLDIFFQGEFRSFGARWINSLRLMLNPDKYSRVQSVLNDIFPKMTGCTWRQHGRGGGIEDQQFLCLLATNIANEKVFIFLWFWYIALFLITLANIGYYCILFFSKDVKWRDRFIDISVRSTRSCESLEKDGCKRNSAELEDAMMIFLKNLSPSKFFFLYLIGKNVDYSSLKQLAQKVTTLERQPPGYKTSIRSKRVYDVQSTVSSASDYGGGAGWRYPNSPPDYQTSISMIEPPRTPIHLCDFNSEPRPSLSRILSEPGGFSNSRFSKILVPSPKISKKD